MFPSSYIYGSMKKFFMKTEIAVVGLVLMFLIGFGAGFIVQEFRKPILTEKIQPIEPLPPLEIKFPQEFLKLSDEQRQKAINIAESNIIVTSIKKNIGSDFELMKVEGGLKTPSGIVTNVVYNAKDVFDFNVSVNLDMNEVEGFSLNPRISQPMIERRIMQLAEEIAKERFQDKYVRKVTPVGENQFQISFMSKDKTIKITMDSEKGDVLKIEEMRGTDTFKRDFERRSFWWLYIPVIVVVIGALTFYVYLWRKGKENKK